MDGEPRRSLPAVGGHHEDGIGRERHRDPVRDPDDADVHPVAGSDEDVPVGGPQTPQDHLLEQLRRRLAGQLLAHPVPASPSARSTTSRSARVAATGSDAATTAEITATPAAPAWITAGAFVGSMPPIPTTGSAVAAATAEIPSSPSASASGFVVVDHTVTPR